MEHTRWNFGHRNESWSKIPLIFGILLVLVLVCGFLSLCGFIVMVLWNWLVPVIFKIQTIDFWQAVGLLLLTQILFRGFNPHRYGHNQWKRRQIWKHLHEEEQNPTV
jgi:energy-coupling factor transporter transmembrane protein EcfT